MAKIRLLIDTDILIDALKGIRPAKELLNHREFDLYCSILSKKELLSKQGLSNAGLIRIEKLLARVKILRIDNDIASKYATLVNKYGEKPETIADFIIAATAWSKKLPLLTRNRKHFKHIEEITLSPVYEPDNGRP
ncbi:MAG: PIN domain-containing protein [Nitrospirota bacterium]